MSEPITITHEHKQYTFDGQRWYGSLDYITPTLGLTRRLNLLIADQVEPDDSTVTSAAELLSRAKRLQAEGQMLRAKKLAERAHADKPRDMAVAAVLAGILREMGQPKKVLTLADRYEAAANATMRTHRAAALCDLLRWDEALTEIREVLAADADHEEAAAVEARIKTNAPKLFADGAVRMH